MLNLNLFWLRRDLRIEDNLAFVSAVKNGLCLPIFILDTYFYENWSDIGDKRVIFMLESIYSLKLSLAKLGLEMLIFYGNPADIFCLIKSTLDDFLSQDGATLNLYFNRDRQILYGKDRDGQVLLWSKNNGIRVYLNSPSFLLLDESKMDTWTKEYYSYQSSDCGFFDTDFEKALAQNKHFFESLSSEDFGGSCLKTKNFGIENLSTLTTNLKKTSENTEQSKIKNHDQTAKNLEKYRDNWQNLKNISLQQQKEFFEKYPKYSLDKTKKSQSLVVFKGGEESAKIGLKSFLNDRYQGYHWKLSFPELCLRGATSQLSPYIMWGCLSTRQVYQKVKQMLKTSPEKLDSKSKLSLNAFLERLRWRENFTQKLYLHPEYATQNRHREFDQLYTWEMTAEKDILWQAFCSGHTGFPLVDASIRQLVSLGWLNFRMRAMLATFLTINMGISWHHGASFFMNHLVDGDIAINHWQWQMQAGVTNPLSKTFRIYSPQKNLIEKDPQLKFVRLWIPELQDVSDWDILNDQTNTPKYPKPILDINQTRLENGKKVSQIRKQVANRILSKIGQIDKNMD